MIINKEKGLKYYLLVGGIANIFIHPILPWIFVEQFFWTPRNQPYEFMIGGIYIAMGIVMLTTVAKPLHHKSFVDFLILGNAFHALVMIVFGIIYQPHHLYGDVIFISLQAIVPVFFYPWGISNFLKSKNT